MDVETGDRPRVIDTAGLHEAFYATVMDISFAYIVVQYDPFTVGWYQLLQGNRDIYYRDSGWRAWDVEPRWKLELVRTCEWCEHDISGPGEAHPILYAGRGWKCANTGACIRRQDFLDAQSGMPPVEVIWRLPVAALEAAR